MTSEQFAYWLQGFCEIHGAPPSAEQWTIIKARLQSCTSKDAPAVVIGRRRTVVSEKDGAGSCNADWNIAPLKWNIPNGDTSARFLAAQAEANAGATNKVIGDVFLMNITGL